MGDLDKRPFRIAELAYRPWDEFPWYVVRTGAVINQGGLGFGTEGMGFMTLEDAVNYMKTATERDLPVIDDMIKEREGSWKVEE
jgi:hypothetical protein